VNSIVLTNVTWLGYVFKAKGYTGTHSSIFETLLNLKLFLNKKVFEIKIVFMFQVYTKIPFTL
jgi:hypothetical protein